MKKFTSLILILILLSTAVLGLGARDSRPLFVSIVKMDLQQVEDKYPTHVSWEVAPSTSSGVLQGYFTASAEEQLEYVHKVRDVLFSKDGRDLLADKIGLSANSLLEAPGYYNGSTSYGFQSLFDVKINRSLSLDDEGRNIIVSTVDPADADRLMLYGSVICYLLAQEGAPWNRFRTAKTPDEVTGTYLLIKDENRNRPLSNEEITILGKEVQAVVEEFNRASGKEMSADDIALISRPGGVSLAYVGGYEDIHGSIYTGLTHEACDRFLRRCKLQGQVEDYRHESDGVWGDWASDPNGEIYTSWAREAGFEELFEECIRTFGPAIWTIQKDFCSRYGWGELSRTVRL